MLKFCPHCGNAFDGRRCGCRPRAKRAPTANDASRAEREPWRAAYSTPEYRRARQLSIARQRGKCADCGKVCAWLDGKTWKTAGMGGEVDHETALCEGGSNDAANLTLRCRSCHAKRDARRRRGG